MFAKSNAGPRDLLCLAVPEGQRSLDPSEHRSGVAHIVFLDRTVLPIEALWVRKMTSPSIWKFRNQNAVGSNSRPVEEFFECYDMICCINWGQRGQCLELLLICSARRKLQEVVERQHVRPLVRRYR